MKNIVACIDFHAQTAIVLKKTAELGKALNAKVWLLHIAAPDPDFVGYEVGPQYIRDDRAKDLRKENKILIDFKNELNEQGIDSDSLLVDGATIETIISEAKKLNADLIVTGHHHHGFFYKAFNSSISSQIISKSNIPVLVVPLE